jgi:glycosyl transferase family 2
MTTSRPAVSVLLTSYNRASFIAASIESVLQQTFTDFELLIVDDCSTDGTLDIVRAYERRDSRIRLVCNDHNLGQFPNRNHAAALARADLMKFHDSDDLMYPHCLQVMVSMLSSEPRAGFGLSKGSVWPGGPCPMLLTPRLAYQREYFGQGMFSCGPSGAIFRTETFRRLGGFENAGVPSDALFWMRACTTENVLLLPADLFWYRVHPHQELQSAAGQQQYARVAGWMWQALNRPECPLSRDEREQARRNFTYHLAKRTMQDLRRGRWTFAARRLRYSTLTLTDGLRYLRRPRRNNLAGTPLGPDGDFVTPSWAVAQHETAHKP